MNIIQKIYYHFFPKRVYTYAELRILAKDRIFERERVETYRKIFMEMDKDFGPIFPDIEIYFTNDEKKD